VIVVNERHLKHLLNEYLSYYHEDRTHLALDKQNPTARVSAKSGGAGCSMILTTSKLGGLHHRYDVAA
jgi:hypothetical protein